MATHDDVRSWVEDYRLAWENADSAAAAALFTEEATYRSNIFEPPHFGHAGIEAYWSGVTAAQSEVTVRMGDPIVAGARADVEFWTTMDVEGAPITLAGCLLLDFTDDGRCARLREYWQIGEGRHDPPEEWGV